MTLSLILPPLFLPILNIAGYLIRMFELFFPSASVVAAFFWPRISSSTSVPLLSNLSAFDRCSQASQPSLNRPLALLDMYVV